MGFDRVVFIADGSNDYCVVKNLYSHDIAIVRKGF